MFVEERKKGVLDISQVPSSITAHGPGYIDRENEVIVGLQTDAPLKRAIMPNGGWRMVVSALEDLRLRARPARSIEIFTDVPQDPQRRRSSTSTRPTCARAAAPTSSRGCPTRTAAAASSATTAASRSTASTRLIEAKQEGHDRARRWTCRRDDVIRDREENSEQIRALKELKQMAASLRLRHLRSRPRTAQGSRPVALLRLPGAVKEQNGAAMSLGRTSTFLDIYFERDLAAGDAHRGTRRRRSSTTSSSSCASSASCAPPSTTSSSPATRPGSRSRSAAWATTAARSSRRRSFRFLQTLYNLGPAPEPNMTVSLPRPARGVQGGSAPRSRSTRSAIQYESDDTDPPLPGATTPRSPAACRRCASASRCSSSEPA